MLIPSKINLAVLFCRVLQRKSLSYGEGFRVRFEIKQFKNWSKSAFSILLLVTSVSSCLVPEKNKTTKTDSTNAYSKADSLLVAQIGADQNGMKDYVIVFLKRGARRWMIDSLTANNLEKSHVANINRLIDEGKILTKGTITDKSDWRGIYIFDVKMVEEAQKMLDTDPAIKAGSLAVEYHPWYGSAAMMKIAEIQAKITKK